MALIINNKYHDQPSYCFELPQHDIIAYNPDELSPAFAAITAAQKHGYYIVGYLSYELGYFLEPALTSLMKNTLLTTPLLHFRCYKNMTPFSWTEGLSPSCSLPGATIRGWGDKSFFSNIKLAISFEEYQQKILQLQKHIYDGETYQTNLTSYYEGTWQGSPLDLFQQLLQQQRVEYAAFLPDFLDRSLLSISPELFFKKKGNTIKCKPMKGTAKRLPETEDDLRQQFYLKTDPKIHAENTMIVDLLRNDLGRISDAGSVNVSQLLTCEHYESMHQMTSTISATLPADSSFETIIQGLFPCGSITGAPKIRTMEIIHALENRQRGVYTGAIGYITPENDMCFNVAIRTAELYKNKITLGVGGGILYDSIAPDEFEEMQLKAKFLLGIAR
ncbi:MAG: aminodeoxychorismate synthase component I [Gammaproteobacteria bacterium]|nr:aminodeoxychorismate synthase component I [Gammaproteobacteria bacterium]